MSVFSCNITFEMVEGDSLASTKNKLVSHSFINKEWDIISLPKTKQAIQELNEEAKEVLGLNVQMFKEDGIKLYPNIEEFNKIDNLISTVRNVLFEGVFSKSLWRGQEQKPIINENGELILIPTYDTLFRSEGISFATNKNLAESYGNRYSKNPYIIEIDKGYVDKIYPLGKGTQNYGNRVIGDEGEERFISKEDIVIPKNKFKIYREDIKYEFSDKSTLFLMDELDKQSYENDVAEFNRYGEIGKVYSSNTKEYYNQIRKELIDRGFDSSDFNFISNNPITTSEEDIMFALNVESWKPEYYKQYENKRNQIASKNKEKEDKNLPVDSSNYNFNLPCITNK